MTEVKYLVLFYFVLFHSKYKPFLYLEVRVRSLSLIFLLKSSSAISGVQL